MYVYTLARARTNARTTYSHKYTRKKVGRDREPLTRLGERSTWAGLLDAQADPLRTRMCVYVHVYMCMYVCMYMNMCVCVYDMYMYVFTYIYAHICICIYVHVRNMYAPTPTHTWHRECTRLGVKALNQATGKASTKAANEAVNRDMNTPYIKVAF